MTGQSKSESLHQPMPHSSPYCLIAAIQNCQCCGRASGSAGVNSLARSLPQRNPDVGQDVWTVPARTPAPVNRWGLASQIRPHGRARVAAPFRPTNEAVRLAVITRLGWISRQRAKFEQQDRKSEREMVSGESPYVQGRRYRLNVIEDKAAESIATRNNARLEIRVRPGADRQDLGVITGNANYPSSNGNYTWKDVTAVCQQTGLECPASRWRQGVRRSRVWRVPNWVGYESPAIRFGSA